MFKLVPRYRLKQIVLKRNLTEEFDEDGRARGSSSLRKIRCKTIAYKGGFVYYKNRIAGWVIAWGQSGEIHVFIFPEFRGKGLFDVVIAAHKKYFPEYNFCPWDKKTLNLFSKKNLPITKKYLPKEIFNKQFNLN